MGPPPLAQEIRPMTTAEGEASTAQHAEMTMDAKKTQQRPQSEPEDQSEQKGKEEQ